MTGPQIVIVGCGARKCGARGQAAPVPAGRMYTGPYFTACLRAAWAITGRDGIFILSAKHGLLRPFDVIAPYDLTLGQPGAITAQELTVQAYACGIEDRAVTALCGARYADLARKVWPDLRTPLAGLGIGQQLHVLGQMRSAGNDLKEQK